MAGGVEVKGPRAGVPRRIFVTGSAGAGKTMLAGRLHDRLGLPHFELDLGPHAFSGFRLDGDWIVEGAHVWQTDRYLERADLIVWLDLPLRHTWHRIVRRHARLSLHRRNRHRGLRLLARFLRSQPRYHAAPARPAEGPTDWAALTRANHERMLQPYQDRLVTLRSPRQVRRWFRSLAS